jgi:hypothetical protein
MAMIKEINTYSFIGHLGPEAAKKEWKEVDEDADIVNCKKKPERACLLLNPLRAVTTTVAGENGGTRHLPVLANDSMSIELVTAPSKGTTARLPDYHAAYIQIGETSTAATSKGEFRLEEGNVLALSPEVRRTLTDDGPTTRLVIYTKKPLHIAKEYPVPDSRTTATDCLFLEPKKVLDIVEEGPSGGKHFELLENEDILIETTIRSDSQRIYHRGFNQDEVAFQLTGQRGTRTDQGEFMLDTGDMLWIPPGCSHRNVGDMLTTRIIIYTPQALTLSDEYSERMKKVEAMRKVG